MIFIIKFLKNYIDDNILEPTQKPQSNNYKKSWKNIYNLLFAIQVNFGDRAGGVW